MDSNWALIYSTGAPYKIELLKGMLAEHEIDSVIINKQDSSYLIGELELYVKAEDVVKAKRIISVHGEF
jgi:hypothetical protein